MPRLKQRNLVAFSNALATLYAEAGEGSLTQRILGALRDLFACDFATFSLLDLRHARWHFSALSPAVPDWPGIEVYQQHLRADPVAAHIMRTRDRSALKISDFVSLRQYRGSSVYNEVFRQVDCDRRLGFAVQDASPVTLAITLNRKRRDFSDEERCLLNLLRPHLLRANAQASADRTAREERERERVDLGDAFGVGLCEIDCDGRIRWSTPRAEKLLGEFFPLPGHPVSGRHLPGEMMQPLAPVLRSALPAYVRDPVKPRPLVWYFPGSGQRRLKMRLAACDSPGRWQLILEETDATAAALLLAQVLKLTPREGATLYWVMEGKTNWEIGQILTIHEKTVGKHLEHIYAKLDVASRTGAMRLALEVCANA